MCTETEIPKAEGFTRRLLFLLAVITLFALNLIGVIALIQQLVLAAVFASVLCLGAMLSL